MKIISWFFNHCMLACVLVTCALCPSQLLFSQGLDCSDVFDITLECDEATDDEIASWIELSMSNLRGSLLLECGTDADVTITYNYNGIRPNTTCSIVNPEFGREVIFTVNDDCGVETNCIGIVTIEDTSPPQLDCSVLSDLHLEGEVDHTSAITAWIESSITALASSSTDICDTFSDSSITYDYDQTQPVTEDETSFESAIGELVTFTATDNCGNTLACSALIKIISVDSNSSIACTISSVNTICGEDNGELLAIADGGIPPYEYIWSTGNNTATVTGLSSGVYTVTIEDAEGQTGYCEAHIGDSESLGCVLSNNNGIVSAEANGGIPPYTFVWSNGVFSSTQNTDLEPGLYQVTITDTDGCFTVCAVTIDDVSNVDCLGVSNGTAQIDTCGLCLQPTDSNFNMSCVLTDCAGIQNGISQIDTCGVCLLPNDPDFNKSCREVDCAGVFEGTAQVDTCGVCLEPTDPNFNIGCAQNDCAGVPDGSSQIDTCGVCLLPTDPMFNISCAAVDCAGVVNGTSQMDTCGVCLQPSDPSFNLACVQVDCAGVPNGSSQIDTCGVCLLPTDPIFNTSCAVVDCAGVVNGTSQMDTCGICLQPTDPNFNLECAQLDCAGIPNGMSQMDTCGVCLLPTDPTFNISCAPLDCAGVPNGSSDIDTCGVCLFVNDPMFNLSCAIIDCMGIMGGTAVIDSCGECLDPMDPNFNQSCLPVDCFKHPNPIDLLENIDDKFSAYMHVRELYSFKHEVYYYAVFNDSPGIEIFQLYNCAGQLVCEGNDIEEFRECYRLRAIDWTTFVMIQQGTFFQEVICACTNDEITLSGFINNGTCPCLDTDPDCEGDYALIGGWSNRNEIFCADCIDLSVTATFTGIYTYTIPAFTCLTDGTTVINEREIDVLVSVEDCLPTGPCDCVMEMNPVCGADGITYNNACLAECAGADVASQGTCIMSGEVCADFPWVQNLLDCDDCGGTTFIILTDGTTNYVAIVDATTETIYNADGSLFCESFDDFSCLDFYNTFIQVYDYVCSEPIEIVPADPCSNLDSVDFGDCDFPLGVGIVNQQCITISGCDIIIGSIDYGTALYTSIELCMDACFDAPIELAPECLDLGGINFGDCEAVLGFGHVGQECIQITGCSTISGNTDYAASIYSSSNVCLNECTTPVESVPSCTNVIGIDFGQCDAVLGAAVIGDRCVEISGCSFIVGDTDYSNAFYSTVDVCFSSCIGDPCELCTTEFDPVCGSDGQTYNNACEASCAGVTVAYTGNCIPTPTGPVDICNDFPWINDLMATCTNESFTLYTSGIYFFLYVSSADQGTLYFQNGSFYCSDTNNNSCINNYSLNIVIETWRCGVDICNGTTGCDCPHDFAPVCGVDNYTYATACEAECNNVEIQYYGTCVDQCEGTFTTAVYTDVVDGVCSDNYFELPDGTILDDVKNYYSPYLTIGTHVSFYYNTVDSESCFTSAHITCLNIEENTGGGGQTGNEDIFNEFPWLNGIVDPNNCNGISIDVYEINTWPYIYVNDNGLGHIYDLSGTLFCSDFEGFNCLDFYSFDSQLDSWACGDNNRLNDPQNEVNLTGSSSSLVSLYPNPVSGLLTVEGELLGGTNILFYNSQGMILKEVAAGDHKNIDVSELPSGVYMVQLHKENQPVPIIKKLVKL